MSTLGFRPVKKVDGGVTPPAEAIVISNSMTLQVGDPVKFVAGAGIEPADAVGDKIYGYLVGFVVDPGRKNLPLETVANNSTYVDGTYTSSPQGDTYVSAADNLTDKRVAGLVVRAHDLVVSVLPDATPGTTTGSNLVGYYLDILTTDPSKVDESTASTTAANYLTVPGRSSENCIDPTDSTRILVVANETQIPGIGTAAST